MEFMQWTENRYLRPVVMVDATPAANAACLRNGFDLVQLLRPFAVLHNTSLTAHVGEKGEMVTVKNFGVRLVRRECVRPVGTDGYRQHVQRVMRGAAAMDLAYGEQLDRAVAELIDPVKGGPRPSPARMSSPAIASTLLERSQPVWHQQFIKDYHTLVRCSEFETTDHPIGAIFAASTAEPGGIDGILRAFKAQAQSLRQLKTELPNMDPEIHQYYILVHDMTGGLAQAQAQEQEQEQEQGTTTPSAPATATSPYPTLQDARRFLAAAQQLHGSNYCVLIRINSVANPQDVKCLDPTPWLEANPVCVDVPAEASVAAAAAAAAAAQPTAEAASGPSPPAPLRFPRLHSITGKWPNGVAKVTGCYMSPENVAEVKDVMGYYLSMSLFRFMERRLRVLDASVQDRRTTTLGKVANWFKSKEEHKPRAEVYVPTNGEPPRYLASSLEMMMRHCGDLSMFLQDYEGAVDYYKLCLDELVSSLAQRPFNHSVIAGCQEGIGIAYFFLGKLIMPSTTPWYTGGTRASLKAHHTCRLEIALNDYLAGGAQAYAMRMGLFLYEFCRTRSPPAMDRAKACLQHVLRSGLTNNSHLFGAIVSDMLAATSLFVNPPYPAGLAMSPTGIVSGLVGTGAFTMPANYPVEFKLRTYVRFLLEAGARYNEARATETALRCYLRVMEILRVLGGRGCWEEMHEHVLMTVSRMYFTLGQNIKGLVVASAAVAQGVPQYSNRQTGLESFEHFWERQAKVLQGMGYSLSPHIPMPCIDRTSFRISYNAYFTDSTTQAEAKQIGTQTVEQEWREVENMLRNHFNKRVLRSTTYYKFPNYDGELKRDLVFPSAQEGGATAPAPTAAPAAPHHKHYYVAHTEPLWLSFVLHNPVGGAITASNISILYMSRQKPNQLWKSAATKTVTLEPGARREVDLAFSPLEAGEYVVIGLCWSLLGQEGYYYFATKESRPGCSESLYEYAIEHPAPSLDAEENITVTVTAPRAWVTATLEPSLPPRLRDGEYFHTSLVVTNGSTHEAATHLTLQRSPRNAHLAYLEDFGIAKNLHNESPMPLAPTLAPGESKRFRLTVRAQHDRGDAAVMCMNSLFFLIGYVPGDVSAPPPAHAGLTPTMGKGRLGHNTRSFSGNHVRLHRLLRRFEVVPLMALYSTVLPPSNASLVSAVVITAKHIPTSATTSTKETTGTTMLTSPQSSPQPQPPTSAAPVSKPPVRVSRVMALHRPQWSVNGAGMGDLTADRAADCVVPAGSSLTLSLLVRREPREEEAEMRNMGMTASSVKMLRPQPTEDEETFEDLDSDVEEAEKDGSATARDAASVYVDGECLPLQTALPSKPRADALVANIGDGLAASAMNRFFMRTSFLGAGGVGDALDQQGDALAFYLDKAGQAAETRQEKRLAERRNERRIFGGLLEKYTPLVVGVAWLVDNGPDAPSSSGQLFHFVDPVSFLQQPALTMGTAHAEDHWEQLSGATASVEHQRHLCECLTKNQTTVATQQGALLYHCRVPARVETTPNLPAAALAPVLFRCLSLSPVPLLVEVAAADPTHIASSHQSSVPLMFVGKTKHSFLLLPSATHEVSFVAHVLIPGITNCNSFRVTATPLLFQPGLDLRTGMTCTELVRKVRDAVAGSGSSAPGIVFEASQGSVWNRKQSVAAEDDVDGCSFGTPSMGPASASSFGASAHSRTTRAARSLRAGGGVGSLSFSNASVHASARHQVEDFLQLLMPRGFHRKRVRVLGRDVPALTDARFLHLGPSDASPSHSLEAPIATPSSLSFQEASAAAFEAKNKLYAEEIATYEHRMTLFQEKEEARAATSRRHTTYVYRPRVRVLSPTRETGSTTFLSRRASATVTGSATTRAATAATAADALSPLLEVAATTGNTEVEPPQVRPSTQAPSLDDLFGPPVAPVTPAAAPSSATPSATTSPSTTPPLEPRKRPQGLVPLEQLMPVTPEKVRLSGVPAGAAGSTNSDSATARAVPPSRAEEGKDGPPEPVDGAANSPLVADAADVSMPAPFSPILPRAARTTVGFNADAPLPQTYTGGPGATAAITTSSEGDASDDHPHGRKDSPSTLLLASPLHLPAHGRSLSQVGVEVLGEGLDSGVGSPVLLPHDASRVAFPVTEGEEDEEDREGEEDRGSNADRNNRSSLTTVPPSTTSAVTPAILGSPVNEGDTADGAALHMTLPPAETQRRGAGQNRRSPTSTSSSDSDDEAEARFIQAAATASATTRAVAPGSSSHQQPLQGRTLSGAAPGSRGPSPSSPAA